MIAKRLPMRFEVIQRGSAVIATLLSSIGLQAHAQSTDYGALEQLFGEPVTTSATGSPLRQNDVPADMVIVTQEDIRRSGADNIPDILQFVAGIDVRRYGASQAEVAVRGYDQPWSPRLLVLINGRQVYIDEYGYTAWQTLPVQLSEIRQIEVVKGPNSALFGFNAAAGVINIVTFDPLTESTNAATFSGGTHDYTSASAVGTVHFGGRGGIRFSAGGSRSNEFSTLGLTPEGHISSVSDRQFDGTPHHYAFSADGRFKATPAVELIAEATVSNSRAMETTSIPTFAISNLIRTNSAKLGLVADTSFGLLDTRAYRNELDSETQTSGPAVLSHDIVYVLQASDLLKVGARNTVRLGIEYRNDSAAGTIRSGTIGYDDYAASGMWHWQVSPKVSFTNAIRFDYAALTFSGSVPPNTRYTAADYSQASLTSIAFNSGLVYDATDADTLRLIVARGIEAPSLVDFGLQSTFQLEAFQISFIGNPNVNPARITNYEVDYDRDIAALNAVLRIAAYYQRTDDLLVTPFNAPFVAGNGGLAAYAENAGSSEEYGGEIGIERRASSGLRWSASYAYLTITDHTTLVDTIGEFTSALAFASGSPTSVVKFGVGYSKSRIEADLQARWQSHFTDYRPPANSGDPDGVDLFPIGSYLAANARVGYRVTDHMTVAISGQNLTCSNQRQTAGPRVQRRVMATLRLQF
jgi:outer membrane receptor protein involved in Fe transport